MKYITLFITLFFLSSASYSKENKPLRPLDPGYEGVHNMVLVSNNSTIYAANLPSYNKPHDVQLLYKLESISLALLQAVRDGQLTTIKTKPFNFDQLIRGDKVTISADVYSGHFNRGGMLIYKDLPLNFGKQLYVRKFDDLKPSSNRQEYDVVSLNKNYKIYIHRIQQAPSYAQLMHIDIEAGCLASFNTSSSVPKETETQFKFMNCGSMKPLYFETQDFSG